MRNETLKGADSATGRAVFAPIQMELIKALDDRASELAGRTHNSNPPNARRDGEPMAA